MGVSVGMHVHRSGVIQKKLMTKHRQAKHDGVKGFQKGGLPKEQKGREMSQKRHQRIS